ncbi:ATP-binding protein [Marinobacter nauticus]|uniref:ATP-binding protein n=1 Tax=Marinobacter nauticus TaxID=2743 RepID=UPI001C99983F|nr:ATP-binding protein [Marinobacter nauticus]MBY5938914.1 ATP-binding protein [Marinobacter nauticus]MBY5956143.1 ATP-binding protein [Marinobacter nauticus]MBY6009934.1 ATP-binding protein [Marinobacter nauticus]
MTATEQCYGLQSIILHHSFDQVKGRTVRINCAERTHIGGVNGAGKTSVLSLIPAFFGEEPERIVSKGSGRLSFVDYYLPSQQSLVIFEYTRYSGVCCAIMYRHPTGKLCYRFVEGAADETFFAPGVIEELQAGSTHDLIFSKLQELGRKPSQMVDTITNYRAIIQRNQKLIKRNPADARKLRALAADYGLGSANTQMSHIDRLTHVVLNKNRLMSSFKTMIVETQFENIHLHGRPRAIDEKDLVKDIKSLKAFEKQEPKIRDCLVKESERKAIETRMEQTVSNLVETVDVEDAKRKEYLQFAEQVEEALQTKEDAFNQQDGELGRQHAEKEHQWEVKDKDLQSIYEARDQFETAQLPELVQAAVAVGELRARFRNAEADLASLTDKVTQIDSEYNAETAAITHQHTKAQAGRQSRIDGASNAHKDAKGAHESAIGKLEREKLEKVAEYKESRRADEHEIRDGLSRGKTLLEHQGPTQEEQGSIEEAESALNLANEQLTKVVDEFNEAREKSQQANRDREHSQRSLGEAEDALEVLNHKVDSLQRQITPDDSSWLSSLRKEDPKWALGLAKLINPDLLERKDLNPQFEHTAPEQQSAVMGWNLDLTVLPVPEFAVSEEELQERLKQLDDRRNQARKTRDAAEKDAETCNKAHQERVREEERLTTERRLMDDMVGRLRGELKQIRSDVKTAITDRRRSQQELVAELEKRLASYNDETISEVKSIEGRFSQRRMDLIGLWADEEEKLKSQMADAQRLFDEAEVDHEQRLASKKTAYEQRLSEEGIDPLEVRKAKNKVDALKAQLQRIESAEDDIRRYQHWLKNDWARVDGLTATCHQLKTEEEQLAQKRKAAELAQVDVRKEHYAKIKSAKEQARTIKGQIEEANGILGKVQISTELPGLPGNIQNLTRELQDAFGKLTELRRDVLAAFRSAQGVLNQYPDSQIQKSWQKLRELRRSRLSPSESEFDEPFMLAQVEDLRYLLDQDTPHLRQTLIEQFSNEAGKVCDYFDGLETVMREVSSVSRTLRQKINTDQQIDSLSDIQVVLKPRIEDDDSWAPLKAFTVQWRDWQASHRREIPSDAVLSAFQLVTATLSSANLGESIESMVDMHLTMKENGRDAVIRNDNDFLNASSQGLTYLAIMAVFMGLTRYLCPDNNTRITWPIDELGTLSPNNIARLADMLEHNNLTMVSACPKLDRPLRKFFENKVSIQKGRIHNFEQAAPGTSQKALLSRLTKPSASAVSEGTDYAE